jgi:3',5'-cyclic AMP phosphodiesterase CpdA
VKAGGALLVVSLALASCKRDAPLVLPPLPVDLAAVADVDAGTVLIAAAGDISDSKLSAQAQVAELVADGGYEAVLLLGDNQYMKGALEDYRQYFAPTWGRFKERLYPVPGNHEYLTPNAAGYFTYFGERAGDPQQGWYSFDVGAWHLIALNTNNGCRTIGCDVDSAQLRWLRADLAKHRNRCTLAFWHHPRWSSGQHHGPFKGADALWQTLAQYGADVVLNGHEHFYERFEPIDGMREFIVGTGGMGHYEVKNPAHPGSAVREIDTFGFLELTLSPGSYAWRFVPLPPATFTDSGSGTCR